MNILITGSSGLIGTALRDALSEDGHSVFRMLRAGPGEGPFWWHPADGKIGYDESIPIDAVVNLAGENVFSGRWSRRRKQEIMGSRVSGTRLLAETLSKLRKPPRVLLSGSAVGYYGDTGDDAVGEGSASGDGFLAEVCREWEASVQPAADSGIRTVLLRTGIVLSPLGGALREMLLPFRFGLGGPVGKGRQYMSWVTIDDAVAMIRFLMEEDGIEGPVNLVSRRPVTNRAFAKALGSVLRRPAVMPLPGLFLRLAFGERADLLLASSRVLPGELEKAGYPFRHDDLEAELALLLDR